MANKKYRSGKLNPVTEQILVDTLKLWQEQFVGDIRKMQAEGKRSMFRPNCTAVMMYDFGVTFGVDELIDTKPILE